MRGVMTNIGRTAVRIVFPVVFALIVAIHAVLNFYHIHYLGFPDGGTEYDSAVKIPLTVYAWMCVALGVVSVFISCLADRRERWKRSLIIATVLYALFSFVAHYGIEYYFGAMMMLNRGSGG